VAVRITKLEVDNKKLRDENEELRRRFENQADDERRLREREREEETELHEQLLLKRKLVSMADENSRLRQEVEKLNEKMRAVAAHLQRVRDLANVDILQCNNAAATNDS
jgi:predicted RNase H-like nuclease (RuvC/YqgF family)